MGGGAKECVSVSVCACNCVREDVIEKLTFEQRLEEGEG